MAEETVAEAPKKKNNKMSVIIVCVVMLFTGGFFGLKMKGGGKNDAAEVKLDKWIDLDEFLVNLMPDGKTFLRTKISLQAKKDAIPKDEWDMHLDAIKDKIVTILSSEDVTKIAGLKEKKELKARIADAVNKELSPKAKPDPAVGQEHPDFDSTSGPVYRVAFTTFAFQ